MTVIAGTLLSSRWPIALTTVFAAALAVRLAFLGGTALWLDEAYSVWFSNQSWSYLWREVPQFETHPPLYYSLLKVWRGLGSEEAVLRLPSVLASVAAAGMVALTAGMAAPKGCRLPLATGAALLFAATPMQIELAQQARPYALLMLGLGVVLACASWILSHPQEAAHPLWRGRSARSWAPIAFLGLGVGAAMVLWLHNLGAIFVAVVGAVLLAWWVSQRGLRAPLLANLLFAALLAAILYAPNFPTLLLQTRAVSENFWLQALSPAALFKTLVYIYGQWQPLLQRPPDQLAVQILVAVPLITLGIKGVFRLSADSVALRWNAFLLLATAFGPLLIMLTLTYTTQPVLLPRTLAPVQLSWAVLCAAAPFAVSARYRRVVWGVIAGLGLLSMVGFAAGHATPSQRDALRPWRTIAATLVASDAAAAPIVVIPNSAALPLAYYEDALGADLAIHPLPAPYPARDDGYRYPSGNRGVPAIDEAMLPALLASTADTTTVWLITRAERAIDPRQMVRNTLADRFPCAKSQTFGPMVVTRFDRTCP